MGGEYIGYMAKSHAKPERFRPKDGEPLSEEMAARIENELSEDHVLCPFCYARYLVPGTRSAEQFGACPTCYSKALAAVYEDEANELAARRKFNAQRQRRLRERKRNGLPTDGRDRIGHERIASALRGEIV